MERHALTDGQWERLRPLLPPPAIGRGRPRVDDRTIVDGIVWRLATGSPWRDLPARFGSWRTVYSRFRRWQQAGIWQCILTALQAEAAHDDGLDGTLTMIDSSSIRAHQHAAGARKGGTQLTRGSVAAGVASGASCTSSPSAGASRLR